MRIRTCLFRLATGNPGLIQTETDWVWSAGRSGPAATNVETGRIKPGPSDRRLVAMVTSAAPDVAGEFNSEMAAKIG